LNDPKGLERVERLGSRIGKKNDLKIFTSVGAGVDTFLYRLYKVFMKTLTITDAKKNLGRWLTAAARGEDIGIISGADIIALRRIEVESSDYAEREYGATPGQVAVLEKATGSRYRKLRASKKLVTATAEELRKLLG